MLMAEDLIENLKPVQLIKNGKELVKGGKEECRISRCTCNGLVIFFSVPY